MEWRGSLGWLDRRVEWPGRRMLAGRLLAGAVEVSGWLAVSAKGGWGCGMYRRG